MSKRFLTTIIIFTLMINIVLPCIQAAPQPSSIAAALLDFDTGRFLYLKNADQPLAPASITKIMTLFLAFDALEAGSVQLQQNFTVSKRAAAVGESTMWLAEGDRVSFEQLIKGVAIASGNDASFALAEAVSGTVELFIDQMNKKAATLGLASAHFSNTHGLDEDDHLISARDIAMLGYYLIKEHPEALNYTSQTEMTFSGEGFLTSRNPLLGVYEGADGLKTGYTDASLNSLLATAKRGDIRLISVIVGAIDENVRYRETVELLNYGFSDNFERRALFKTDDVLEQVLNVRRAEQDQITLTLARQVDAVIDVAYPEAFTTSFDIPAQMDAPISKGDVVGQMTLFYDNIPLEIVDIVAAEDSGEAGFFKSLWQSIVEFFSGLFRFK